MCNNLKGQISDVFVYRAIRVCLEPTQVNKIRILPLTANSTQPGLSCDKNLKCVTLVWDDKNVVRGRVWTEIWQLNHQSVKPDLDEENMDKRWRLLFL